MKYIESQFEPLINNASWENNQFGTLVVKAPDGTTTKHLNVTQDTIEQIQLLLSIQDNYID